MSVPGSFIGHAAGTLGRVLRPVRERLARRPDSEHVQAVCRLFLLAAFAAYAWSTLRGDPSSAATLDRALSGVRAGVAASLAILAWILANPGASAVRRVAGMLLDTASAGYQVFLLGFAGIPLYFAYFWITIGNGFRFGRRHLLASFALNIASFLTVLACSDYWIRNRTLGLFLLFGMAAVSLYQAIMIGARDRMEQNLKTANEELFRTNDLLFREKERAQVTLYSIGDAVLVTDVRGRVEMINRAGETLTGWTLAEARGRPVEKIFRVICRKGSLLCPELVEEIARRGEVVELEGSPALVSRDGTTRSIESSGAPIRDPGGSIIGFILVFRDITEKEKREELVRSREQLSKLAAHLQKAREEERTRIAREIHDELGNMLTVLKLELANLPLDDPGLLKEKVLTMSAHIGNTGASLRKIVTQLRPALLDTVGPVAAIAWLIRDFRDRTGIDCESTLPREEIPMDPDVSTTLFRILQEALTNVARHSGANLVRVRLSFEEGGLVLQIRDNGRGITEEQMATPKSFGLIGIRERVEHWGGQAEIQGEPGRGTSLTVSIPLRGVHA